MKELTQKALPCGHSITIAGSLKMGEFRRWVAAEKEGDLEAVYPYLAKVVTAWDWADLDPKAPESYDELLLSEYRQVVQAVSEYLMAEAASKN